MCSAGARAKDDTALLPGQAAALAAALARLLDMAASEEASFDRLRDLAPAEFAEHWQLVLDFLDMLPRLWPPILEAEGAIDPADRRNRLLRRQARLWRETPPRAPVIAAGLMGGMPALTDLLSAVAWLDQGAVILPGLDRAAEPRGMGADRRGADPSAASDGAAAARPGTRAGRGARLAAAAAIGAAPSPGPQPRTGTAGGPTRARRRLRLVAQALRPAALTDAWRDLPPEGRGRARRAVAATTAPARRTRRRRSRCCCGGRSKRRA